jgi:hypothetical protein
VDEEDGMTTIELDEVLLVEVVEVVEVEVEVEVEVVLGGAEELGLEVDDETS